MDQNLVPDANGGYLDPDEAYERYMYRCKNLRIVPEPQKRFSFKMGKEYSLRNRYDQTTKKHYKVFEGYGLIVNSPMNPYTSQKTTREPANKQG